MGHSEACHFPSFCLFHGEVTLMLLISFLGRVGSFFARLIGGGEGQTWA